MDGAHVVFRRDKKEEGQVHTVGKKKKGVSDRIIEFDVHSGCSSNCSIFLRA
jgi:hypothetical protein